MKIEGNAHKDNVASYFSQTASYWERAYEQSGNRAEDFRSYANGRRKSIVVNCLDAYARQNSLSVLDIGCGPGVFMEQALLRGHEVAGIDISDEMVRKTVERLAKSGRRRFTCQQGDAESIPFGDNTMDVVLCLGVLPYVKDERKAIEEVNRVLKEGGVVIAVLPNIFKLSNVLDCYYYVVRIWQYVWYQLLRKNAAPRKIHNPGCFGGNKDFVIRRYTLSQAAGLFERHGIIAEENIAVIEFGPLTIWRRKILSDKMSIMLSEVIVKLSRRWPWLKNFSNEWVICFIKSS